MHSAHPKRQTAAVQDASRVLARARVRQVLECGSPLPLLVRGVHLVTGVSIHWSCLVMTSVLILKRVNGLFAGLAAVSPDSALTNSMENPLLSLSYRHVRMKLPPHENSHSSLTVLCSAGRPELRRKRPGLS